jgi:hypothetical protein
VLEATTGPAAIDWSTTERDDALDAEAGDDDWVEGSVLDDEQE